MKKHRTTTKAKKTAPKKASPKKTPKEHALQIGDLAPNFTLSSTNAKHVALSDLRGKRVVLYFYPKDMTSGCTVEAHEFSKLAKKFLTKDAVIFGVSPDSIESHHKFIARDKITFSLLADVGHRVAEAYGVWVEKSMYGKKYMGIERSTFVIGPDGTLEAIYRKVKPEGHAVCVLDDLTK